MGKPLTTASSARIALALALTALAVASIAYAGRVLAGAWIAFPPATLVATPERARGVDPDALRRLSRAVRFVPGDAQYAFARAETMRRRARDDWFRPSVMEGLDTTVDEARRSVSLNPTQPYARVLLGGVLLDRARHPRGRDERPAYYVDAIEELTRAVELAPASPAIRFLVGSELLQAWSSLDAPARELAIDVLRSASAWEREQHVNSLGLIETSLEPAEQATVAAAITPDSEEGLARLGAFLERLARANVRGGDDGGEIAALAVDAYRRAAALVDYDVRATRRWIGQAARLQPQAVAALVHDARELTEQRPDAPSSFVALALAAGAAGDDDLQLRAAARALEIAESRSPDQARLEDVLAFHADTHFDRERYELALASYERLAALRPRDPNPLIRAGLCHEALGRGQLASRTFELAVQRAPRSRQARLHLAAAMFELGEYLGAIEHWRSIAVQDGRNWQVRAEIARAYRELGLVDDALRYYREALEIQPGNAGLRNEMRDLTGEQRP